ncbi:Protein of unknown function [Pyronema omphalodes CBS 100304]|uniref:Uncharacterized protein n=1 Tax=Pyronema omphalodes (strain CBS 100304) TaxID=1076935 RepID=U4L0G7_PYROM|nr:Protein of unknown function [Pyronema omphalodes CBS 100304]
MSYSIPHAWLQQPQKRVIYRFVDRYDSSISH